MYLSRIELKTKASLYLGESDTGWFYDKNISKNTTPMVGEMAGSLYSMFGVLTEMLSRPGTSGSNDEPKSQPQGSNSVENNTTTLVNDQIPAGSEVLDSTKWEYPSGTQKSMGRLVTPSGDTTRFERKLNC
ncbi:hypothetical protein [Flammeovirga pacifica]|uniref:Uncharacterized protein n=1 Tax=Flammeovirga pacifica TaxID=915059 RepID=A0A1S1YY35_FLAPC|nr:hypothetical protein [Flammeovirga pacifica]OHX65795.1 hypothetical protein NH26_05240 [Flammeovirga pacifica]